MCDELQPKNITFGQSGDGVQDALTLRPAETAQRLERRRTDIYSARVERSAQKLAANLFQRNAGPLARLDVCRALLVRVQLVIPGRRVQNCQHGVLDGTFE